MRKQYWHSPNTIATPPRSSPSYIAQFKFSLNTSKNWRKRDIIYELMDEMVDFKYPQTRESKILQE